MLHSLLLRLFHFCLKMLLLLRHICNSFRRFELTRDLQQQTPRLLKRPHLPLDEACTPRKRIVHTAMYKSTNITKFLNYEQYNEYLLSERPTEVTKNFNNVDALVNNLQTPSKLAKFKKSIYKSPRLLPLRVHIPRITCHNCFQCYPHRCAHLPHNRCNYSPFLLPPFSPTLILIKIEPLTPHASNFFKRPNSFKMLTVAFHKIKHKNLQFYYVYFFFSVKTISFSNLPFSFLLFIFFQFNTHMTLS